MKTQPAPELRSAVRFPLKLAASIDAGPAGQLEAETQDISAAGVLFHVDVDMAVGSLIEFTINLPKEVLGNSMPVEIKCVGRVVRCAEQEGRRAVAAVIDQYEFQRR